MDAIARVTVTRTLALSALALLAFGAAMLRPSITSANALIPGFVKFGQRQIIELGQTKVFDGGADGNAATNDNNLFQIQGIFNP
jgi:hypothetical protein